MESVKLCPVCGAGSPPNAFFCEAEGPDGCCGAPLADQPVVTREAIALGSESEAGAEQRPQTTRTVISGERPSTPLGEGRSQGGSHGWLPVAIATTMQITEPLPTRGAEADLYIVEDETGARHVAKVYRYGIAPKAEVLDRIRQASATHVVRLEDYGVEDGRWWELLEHIEHRSLRERLADAGGALPDADVRCVLAQLADGLDSLHAIGLEHRDLKPENVLVRCGEPLDVAIADWGIASMVEATVHFTTMARTIRYAPPEAIGNVVTSEEGVHRTVSAIERTRWDAWSLGMMTVEMKTGMHPFAQVSEQVVGHRLATQSVDALCEHVTNPAWWRLCRGLLRRQPADRWGTAEIRRWLANADDSTLTIADDQPMRAHTGIDFDGRHFTDRRALGRALQQADQAKVESFWKRRFRDLRTWITDSLGEGALGKALEDLARDPNLSLGEQVFSCIHLLWPEAPIIVDGVPFREDVLHEMARRAWEGDDEAAALLVRVAVDRHVSLAVGLDATGVVDWIHKAWQRAADHYASASRILAGQDLSIPEWRNAELGSPDQTIEVGTVAGVEIGVDTITGAPRLPVQIQAGVLGAAIGETTCSKALRTTAEQATARWGEVEPLLAEMGSHGAANPALLAATIYGALEIQKRDDEARAEQQRLLQQRADEERAEQWRQASRVVWMCYGAVVGLCLGVALAAGSELQTAWVDYTFAAILATLTLLGVAFVWTDNGVAAVALVGLCLGAAFVVGFETQAAVYYYSLAALFGIPGLNIGRGLEGAIAGAVASLCLGAAIAVGIEPQAAGAYLGLAILFGVIGFGVGWIFGGGVAGLCLGVAFAAGFDLQVVWVYWTLAALFGVIGFGVGAFLEHDFYESVDFSSPANEPKTPQEWQRRHVLRVRIVAAAAIAGLWALSIDVPSWLRISIVVVVAVIGLWVLSTDRSSDADTRG